MHRSPPWEMPWQAAARLVLTLLIGPGPVLFADDTVTNAPLAETAQTATNTVPQPSPIIRSRPAGVVAFALIGTASYRGGEVAFFDGSRDEFKTSVHPGEKIGEWIVAVIAFDHVRLTHGATQVDLPIEKQLRRENSGDWKIQPLTTRFSRSTESRSRSSGNLPETAFDRRPSSAQASDAGSAVRPGRADRRSTKRANRGGFQPGQ